jgi:hypothetical protein
VTSQGALDGSDVIALLKKVEGLGASNDPNAFLWCERFSASQRHQLDGSWASRWNGGSAKERWITGVAQVHVIGDQFLALTHDSYGHCIISARIDHNRLAGRYFNLTGSELLAWAGRIVSDDRIDGLWTGGRWDLRRCKIF